jgi:hypothetical protein
MRQPGTTCTKLFEYFPKSGNSPQAADARQAHPRAVARGSEQSRDRMKKQRKHYTPEEKVFIFEKKIQTKDEVLAELMAEHVA